MIMSILTQSTNQSRWNVIDKLISNETFENKRFNATINKVYISFYSVYILVNGSISLKLFSSSFE
jgi:hypothetical protein